MSKLKDCITKINAKRSDFKFDQEQLIQMEQDMLDSGVDPLEAARQAAITYHKQLFDEMAEVRKQLGLKPNEYKIGTVGNVEEIEGKYAEMISQAEVLQNEPPTGEQPVTDGGVTAPVYPDEAKEGFTESADLNRMFGELKSKYGKKGSAIYDAAIRLVNPNKNTIIEIRSNGVVVKEGGEYLLKPFTDTDMSHKKWRLARPLNVSDQFRNTETPVESEVTNQQIENQESTTEEAATEQSQPDIESIAADLYNQLNTEEELNKDKARQGVLLLGKQLQSSWAKMLPGLKVVTDNYAYHLTQAKLNGEVDGYMEDYPGFYNPANNTVYLNPQKVGLDTPVHEFGHVWYQVANQTEKGRKILARGRQLIKNSEYLKTVQEQEEYQFPDETPERREELQLEEALITAIGNRGADFVEQSMRNQFVDWLLELLDAINIKIKQFKGKKIDLSSLTLDEYLDLAAADILSGGEVFTIEPTAGAYSAVTSKPVVKNQVIAWHGSPHSFDKFTTEKIGTGEGAQAFGWGLYFTDIREVAENYATKLTGIQAPRQIFTIALGQAIDAAGGKSNFDKQKALDFVSSQPNWTLKVKEWVIEAIENNNIDEIARNLYKVSLHQGKTPDQYDWLVWDKSVDKGKAIDLLSKTNSENATLFSDYLMARSEQEVVNKQVRELEREGTRLTQNNNTTNEEIEDYLKRIRSKKIELKYTDVNKKAADLYNKLRETRLGRDFTDRIDDGLKGGDFYNLISDVIGSDKDASLFLLSNGIDGIKYPAESIARGTTSDNARGFNYVVFDENAVKIEEQIRFSIASTRRIESVIPDVQSKVRKAEEMELKGSTPDTIYKQTGLSRGVEGNWEAELDYDVKFNKGIYLPIIKQQVEKSGNKIYKLSDVISYPQLFKAYPELKNKRVVFISDPEKEWIGAANDKGDIGINLADDIQIEQEEVAYRMGYTEADAVDKAYISTIIHEVQHLIQRMEGWPGGFNLQEAFEIAKNKIAGFFQKEAEATGDQDFLDAANQVSEFQYGKKQEDDLYEAVRIAAERRYAASSGEQQARNVQRRFFDPAKREARPEQTETVPRNEQRQDRIQARLSVGNSNWAKEAENTAQTLLYDGQIKITPNQDGSFTVSTLAGSIRAENYRAAEDTRDRIVRNVLLRKYPQISPWIAEGIVNRAKDKNVFRPVPTFRGEGIINTAEAKPYVPENRSMKDRFFKWASGFLKENFTSTRGLGEDIFNLRGRRTGSIDLLVNEAEGVVKEAKAVAKKIGFTDWDQFDAELRNYNTQIPGNPYAVNMRPNRTQQQIGQGTMLPEEMYEQMVKMRNILDGISEQLVRNGYVTPDMALTIQGNMGKYVHRSYAMFTMGDEWTKQLKEDPEKQWILDNAKQHLFQLYYVNLRAANPYLTEQEISDQANEMADKEIDSIMKTRKSFFGQDTSSFLPYRNTDSLKYRKDMPQWLRDLLGEYKDPGTAFLLSVAETSNLLHNSMYLQDLYRMGKGKFIFEEFDSNRPREANKRIDAPAGSMIAPLNGKFVTEEMYNLLMETQDQSSVAWKWFLKIMNLNKMFKTVLSLGAQTKNFFNNAVFPLVNGNLNREGWRQARKYLSSQLTGNKRLEDIKELEPLFVRGLLSQNITARELERIFKTNDYEQYILDSADTMKSWNDRMIDAVKSPVDTSAKAWRNVYRYASRAYQASDAFWKIQAFFSERKKFSGVLFNKSYNSLTTEEKKQVDDAASERVMNTYPSYDRALKAFLISNRVPILGNFTAFKAEVYRTLYNQYAYGISDTYNGIKSGNQAMTKMGLERIFGAMVHNTMRVGVEYMFAKMLGYGVSGASAILGRLVPVGDDDERERVNKLMETRSAANTFVSQWARSDDKVFDLSKVGETGEITYWIGSNIDPTQGVYNLLNAYVDGNEYYPEGGLKSTATEFVLPFLEPEMTVRLVMESVVGYDEKGEIYAEDDQTASKFSKGFLHIAQQFKPGTMTLVDRIITTKNEDGIEEPGINTNELLGIIGLRPYKQNVKWGVLRVIKSQEKLISQIGQEFNKEYREGDVITERSNERYKKGMEKVKQAYNDALKLGFNSDELYDIIKKSRLPKNAKKYILHDAELNNAWDEFGKIGSKYRFD